MSITPEGLGMWVVIVCAPSTLVIVAFGIAWQISKWRQHVAASPILEAHDEGARRAPADRSDAAEEVHRLPARRDGRDALAGRAPGAGIAGRADDDRELRPLAHVVPMVQASLQPVGGRVARRAQGERAARGDEPRESGTPALVRAIHRWGFAGVFDGRGERSIARPIGGF